MPVAGEVLGVYRRFLIMRKDDRSGVVEAFAGAAIDGRTVRIFREPGEAGFFQQGGPGVTRGHMVQRCQDAANGRIVKQGTYTSPEGRKIDRLLQGMIEAIDADRSGLGKEFYPQIHLNGRMDFQ